MPNCYHQYPLKTVLLSLLITVISFVFASLLSLQVAVIFAFIYIAIFILDISIGLYFRCRFCCYFGKRCASGLGLLDEKMYTGYTKDLKLRLEQHKLGKVSSTKDRRPLKLIYYEASLNQQDATHREKYLKTYLGKMYIKKRLKSYLTG